MFFPFTNYKVVDVPQNNSNGSILYTTTAKSMVFFEPDGAGMESDRPVGVYVESLYVDTDGDVFSPLLWGVIDGGKFDGSAYSPFGVVVAEETTAQGFGNVNGFSSNSMIVPSGKAIKAYINDSSDRIKGKLYIFELPQ